MDFHGISLLVALDDFAARLAPANGLVCAVSKAKKQLLV